MNATLRPILAGVACLWFVPTALMAQAAGEAPVSSLGGRELILIAAIVLPLFGVGRFIGLERAPSADDDPKGVHAAASRAYLDRLVGVARPRPLNDGARP
jgi:hypothetical protein